MRSKNAFRNLITYLVYEAIVFVCGIIFPRFIILNYGSEINGLTATITRILSLINLVQAGAVGAAIFQMYKPVADGDCAKQSAIIYSSKKFYNRVSFVYLLVALAASIFYSFYLRSDNLSFLQIFLSFLILAINGTNALLFNSICDIFVSSHQKKYLLSLAYICEQIVRYGLISIVLFFKAPFIFLYLCYLIAGTVLVILNLVIYKKLSAGIITNNPENKNFKIPNRKYLMLSSIGAEMVTASPTVIITTFIDLIHSSVFSVYSMIFTSMKTILSSIQLSFSAIFGNLTKTEDNSKILDVHSGIELLTIWLGTVASSCVGFLIIPFIKLYSSGADADYLSVLLALFVVAYTIVFSFRTSFGYVATVYGLFKDTCFIVLFFGVLGIVISIVSTILFGMPYVMIGLLFNQIGCSFTTLIVIKKKVKWFRVKKLIARTIVMILISGASTALFFIIKPNISNWIIWLGFAFIVAFVSFIFFFAYCLLFDKKCIKMYFAYIRNIFSKRKSNY